MADLATVMSTGKHLVAGFPTRMLLLVAVDIWHNLRSTVADLSHDL